MGRGRGKGKKSSAVVSHEDPGSGGEESIPAYKRRGRPQKPLKDDIEEEEVEKIEERDGDDSKSTVSNKEMKSPVTSDNGKKRKRNTQVKETVDLVKEENGVPTKSVANDSTKTNGFRQNGSRRKNKPRRAAEAGVECK
ncbi:hypothetical protein ACLOJK_020389 [Asimina triloba]